MRQGQVAVFIDNVHSFCCESYSRDGKFPRFAKVLKRFIIFVDFHFMHPFAPENQS